MSDQSGTKDQTSSTTVLIVDDIPDNIDVLRGILKNSYQLMVALKGEKALQIAQSDEKPDIILLDVMMPGMDGYEVCRRLKGNPSTCDIPVIFVTAKGEVDDERTGFELGAVDYIAKPVNPSIVLHRIRTHITMYDKKRLLEDLVNEQTKTIEQTRLQIIHRLGRAAEYKDNETGLHVIRMSQYSYQLALAYGMSKKEAELILNASPMHDVGKIGVPDHILLKPECLNSEEWQVMQGHPEMGAEIIGEDDSVLLKMAREIALHHHEKYDGSGYPQQLKGENIPLTARIVAIADVFDALTTVRPYKKAWSVEDAVKQIKEKAGTHFDPDLVDIFIGILPRIIKIKEQYAEG